MSALRPGNYDRAWNDPPVFAFNANGEAVEQPSAGTPGQTVQKRTPLNKRVAFPLSGSLGSPSPMTRTDLSGMPPPMAGLPPISPSEPAVLTQPSEVNCQVADNAVDPESVYASLQNAVKKVLGESPKTSDVLKKLEGMETSWKNGKFNTDVQQRLNNLANALTAENYELAEKIQVGLAVDYAAESAGWILAVKHAILNAKEKL